MADVEVAPAVVAEAAAPAPAAAQDQQPKTAGKAKAAAKEQEKPDSDLDLPRALVKRIIKTKLAALAASGAGDKKEFQVNKDALTALSESTKVFISYIASTANDICREKKRQTLSADDVFAALTELEFGEFVEPLQKQLEGEAHACGGSARRHAGTHNATTWHGGRCIPLQAHSAAAVRPAAHTMQLRGGVKRLAAFHACVTPWCSCSDSLLSSWQRAVLAPQSLPVHNVHTQS